MKVLCYGEILFDVIEGIPYPGGAPLNFAAHLSKLGAEAYMYSRIGNDPLGERAIKQMNTWGVQTRLVQIDKNLPTGTVDVLLKDGQPQYILHINVAYDFIDHRDLGNIENLESFDFLYFGTLAQRSEVSRASLWKVIEKFDFADIFFDVNLRQDFYSREIMEISLRNATILKVNDEEVTVLSDLLYGRSMSVTQFCLKVVTDFELKMIIVTRGSEGCYLFHRGELHEVPGIRVEVKDTVGAGDAFSAAFIFFLNQKHDPIKALHQANRLGAFVAGSRGAVPEYTKDIQRVLFEEKS